MPDADNRTLEIHSPDRRHSCVLRCPDAAQCSAWFNAIHSAVDTLMSKAVIEAGHLLKDVLERAELKHMGWLSEKVIYQLIIRPQIPYFVNIICKGFISSHMKKNA